MFFVLLSKNKSIDSIKRLTEISFDRLFPLAAYYISSSHTNKKDFENLK